MKTALALYVVFALCPASLHPSARAEDSAWGRPSDQDVRAFRVCEGVIQLFRRYPDSIWPGYDLSRRPFIFYTTEMALLFNYTREVEGFVPYPEGWPDPGTSVLVHRGPYDGLAGQLSFGLAIDTTQVAAVPYVDKSPVELFAFIVHENFHEYQQYGDHPAFGEIPWAREELYPIEDRGNTALAYLEMRLLMDALRMMKADDRQRCGEYLRQFVAVRDHRWKTSDPFVAKYEQGEEINEGTAKYVEAKSVSLMSGLRYRSSFEGLGAPLSEEFDSLTLFGYCMNDFRARITGRSISPTDVGRYRIYPVGEAQGVLLDYLGIDWKGAAQRAGTEFTYARLLAENLVVREAQLGGLLERAKETYDYGAVLAATDSLIGEYRKGYSEDLASFEARGGRRIEIELVAKNLNRSCSSSARRWIVDRGSKTLRSLVDVYVLRRVAGPDLLLEVHDTGIFEQDDWETRRKKVVFYVPAITSLSLDGRAVDPGALGTSRFGNIEMTAQGSKFAASGGGTVTVGDNAVIIDLIQ